MISSKVVIVIKKQMNFCANAPMGNDRWEVGRKEHKKR